MYDDNLKQFGKSIEFSKQIIPPSISPSVFDIDLYEE